MTESERIGSTMGEVDWRAEELVLLERGGAITREDLFMLHDNLCREALNLLRAKNQDYAASHDPFRNFRTFGELGILVRLSDKIARLHSYIENRKLEVKDESVRDTILDIVNYAVLFHAYLLDAKARSTKIQEK